MYFFTKHKNKVLFIMGFFLIFNTTLFASSTCLEITSSIGEEKSTAISSDTEIALDSFGGGSMTIVLVLTSLLGVFFVRDELSAL